MTIKTALKIIDWWITQKQKSIQRLLQKWKESDFDTNYDFTKDLVKMEKTIIHNLEPIKKNSFLIAVIHKTCMIGAQTVNGIA